MSTSRARETCSEGSNSSPAESAATALELPPKREPLGGAVAPSRVMASPALRSHLSARSKRALRLLERLPARGFCRDVSVVPTPTSSVSELAKADPEAARNAAKQSAGRFISLSFPLDGCRWFAAHVVHDPVDSAHFVGDAAGDAGEQVPGKPRPVRRNAVQTLHRANRARALVGTFITHDANRAHRQHHRKGLPQPRPQRGIGLRHLFLNDGV